MKRQIFPRFCENPNKIWIFFWENCKIYLQKSQCKIDFLAIFTPIFQDLCHTKNIHKFWRSGDPLDPALGEGVVSGLRCGRRVSGGGVKSPSLIKSNKYPCYIQHLIYSSSFVIFSHCYFFLSTGWREDWDRTAKQCERYESKHTWKLFVILNYLSMELVELIRNLLFYLILWSNYDVCSNVLPIPFSKLLM